MCSTLRMFRLLIELFYVIYIGFGVNFIPLFV